MERQIKFRGLDLNGNWVYGGITSSSHTPDGKTYIVSSECKEGFEEDERLVFIEVNPESVGEFTGAFGYDKKEIYEGDKNQDKGVVIWNTDECSFNWLYKNGELSNFEDEKEWCLIIGNIHQQ